MVCFFAAYQNGNSLYLFGHVQFELRCRGILVPLPTGVLENAKVFSLYEVIRLARHDLVLCLLVFRRLQEINWSRNCGGYPPVFGYYFKTGQVFGVPPLRANKRSKTGSGVIVHVPGHEIRWLQEIQFASITRCESGWLEFGAASGLRDGLKVVFVDPPALDDLELLLERDAERTRDGHTAYLEIHRE